MRRLIFTLLVFLPGMSWGQFSASSPNDPDFGVWLQFDERSNQGDYWVKNIAAGADAPHAGEDWESNHSFDALYSSFAAFGGSYDLGAPSGNPVYVQTSGYLVPDTLEATICLWYQHQNENVDRFQTLFQAYASGTFDPSDYPSIFHCYVDRNSRVDVRGRDFVNSNYDNGDLTEGEWSHIAVVFGADASTSVYIDGSLVKTESDITTDSLVDRTAPYANHWFIRIGNIYMLEHQNDGRFDEFRVYNRALTAEEISTVYDYIGATPEPGPTPTPSAMQFDDIDGEYRLIAVKTSGTGQGRLSPVGSAMSSAKDADAAERSYSFATYEDVFLGGDVYLHDGNLLNLRPGLGRYIYYYDKNNHILYDSQRIRFTLEGEVVAEAYTGWYFKIAGEITESRIVSGIAPGAGRIIYKSGAFYFSHAPGYVHSWSIDSSGNMNIYEVEESGAGEEGYLDLLATFDGYRLESGGILHVKEFYESSL